MIKADLEKKLSDLDAEISKVKSSTETLTHERTDALAELDSAAAVDIRKQLQDLQERLEDLAVMKSAVEGKLQVYKHNAPKAEAIRKQVTELWPKAVGVYKGLQPHIDEINKILNELDGFNRKISGLSAEYSTLTGGEPMRYPTIQFPHVTNPLGMSFDPVSELKGYRLPELSESITIPLQIRVKRQVKK